MVSRWEKGGVGRRVTLGMIVNREHTPSRFRKLEGIGNWRALRYVSIEHVQGRIC
jgi:hypothetical protein